MNDAMFRWFCWVFFSLVVAPLLVEAVILPPQIRPRLRLVAAWCASAVGMMFAFMLVVLAWMVFSVRDWVQRMEKGRGPAGGSPVPPQPDNRVEGFPSWLEKSRRRREELELKRRMLRKTRLGLSRQR